MLHIDAENSSAPFPELATSRPLDGVEDDAAAEEEFFEATLEHVVDAAVAHALGEQTNSSLLGDTSSSSQPSPLDSVSNNSATMRVFSAAPVEMETVLSSLPVTTETSSYEVEQLALTTRLNIAPQQPVAVVPRANQASSSHHVPIAHQTNEPQPVIVPRPTTILPMPPLYAPLIPGFRIAGGLTPTIPVALQPSQDNSIPRPGSLHNKQCKNCHRYLKGTPATPHDKCPGGTPRGTCILKQRN
jgi:hypothetical protein